MTANYSLGGSRNKAKEEVKKPVNRKLLVWMFLLTGLISWLVWWRGKVIRESPPQNQDAEMPDKVMVGLNTISPKLKLGEQRLMNEIQSLVATASGRYAVFVYRLGDGTSYGLNQNERMPAASLLKVPVIITVEEKIAKGEMSLSDVFTMEDADRATGSGPLQFEPTGSSYTVEQLLSYLGKNSDNTAWVMFNRRLGKQAMQDTMDKIGMKDSSYNDLVITAADAEKMFKYIYDGRAGGSGAKEDIYDYLSDSVYEDRIPAALDGEGGVRIVHKVGTDLDVWSDAGIVFPPDKSGVSPFILVVLDQGVDRTEAANLVPEIVSRIWGFEENSAQTR